VNRMLKGFALPVELEEGGVGPEKVMKVGVVGLEGVIIHPTEPN